MPWPALGVSGHAHEHYKSRLVACHGFPWWVSWHALVGAWLATTCLGRRHGMPWCVPRLVLVTDMACHYLPWWAPWHAFNRTDINWSMHGQILADIHEINVTNFH